MSDDKNRTLEIQQVSWDALSVHAQGGRVVVIDAERDLSVEDVARALLDDNADRVKAWLADGSVFKPTKEFVERWDACRWSLFRFAIVQPFVVAKLVEEIQDQREETQH